MFIPYCHHFNPFLDNGTGCLEDSFLLASALIVEREFQERRRAERERGVYERDTERLEGKRHEFTG